MRKSENNLAIIYIGFHLLISAIFIILKILPAFTEPLNYISKLAMHMTYLMFIPYIINLIFNNIKNYHGQILEKLFIIYLIISVLAILLSGIIGLLEIIPFTKGDVFFVIRNISLSLTTILVLIFLFGYCYYFIKIRKVKI